ncbi:hypothetical protein AKJ16_DCAP17615 [Drosera capensis]
MESYDFGLESSGGSNNSSKVTDCVGWPSLCTPRGPLSHISVCLYLQTLGHDPVQLFPHCPRGWLILRKLIGYKRRKMSAISTSKQIILLHGMIKSVPKTNNGRLHVLHEQMLSGIPPEVYIPCHS